MTGAAVCDPWSADVPEMMRLKQLPEVPPPYDAFYASGQAIPSVHAAYADIVRSIVSPATYAASRLTQREWAMSAVVGPGGGDPVPELLLRAQNGEDQNDPISLEHWDDVSTEVSRVREELRGARARISLVGRKLHEALVHGRIQSFARSIGGAFQPSKISTAWWELDDPLPRLATCQLSEDFPLDPTAVPTCWIFVDYADLRQELEGLKIVSFYPKEATHDESAAVDPWLQEPLSPAGRNHRIKYSEFIVDEVTSFLIKEFEKDGPWLPQAILFERAQAARGTTISVVLLQAAWRKAAVNFPERTKPGRPRKSKKT